MAIIKKVQITNVDEVMEKKGHWYTVDRRAKYTAANMENKTELPQRAKNRTTVQCSSSTSRYLSEESKNAHSKTYVYPYIYHNIIYIAKLWSQHMGCQDQMNE